MWVLRLRQLSTTVLVRMGGAGTSATQWLSPGSRLPVGRGARVARRTLGHALAAVDDEAVLVRQVDLGAELGADAAPALELVGGRRAVGDAAALMEVVHAGRTHRVAVGGGAAAQALGVAALAVGGARPPQALLRALWWTQGEHPRVRRAEFIPGEAEELSRSKQQHKK